MYLIYVCTTHPKRANPSLKVRYCTYMYFAQFNDVSEHDKLTRIYNPLLI